MAIAESASGGVRALLSSIQGSAYRPAETVQALTGMAIIHAGIGWKSVPERQLIASRPADAASQTATEPPVFQGQEISLNRAGVVGR